MSHFATREAVAYLDALIRETEIASVPRISGPGELAVADKPERVFVRLCNFALRVFGRDSEHYGRLTNLAMVDGKDWFHPHIVELDDVLHAMRDELVLFGPRTTQEPSPTAMVHQGDAEPDASRIAHSDQVFVVHGHDKANLLQLEKLLRDRWNLTPIILRDKPSKGRTLIEKLEQEGQEAGYAFALLSPDDLVQVKSDAQYFQARPNVLFELGWFFGRLGRDRVCILFKKGTKIPSDLDGIMRVEFNETVEEKIIEIEGELEAAGLFEGLNEPD